MASITITDRSSRGVRAEVLARFIAEVRFGPPSVEKSSSAGTPVADVSAEGEEFIAKCRALVEDIDGASSAASALEFIDVISESLPKVFESPATDAEVEASVQILLSFVNSASYGSAEDAAAVLSKLSGIIAATPQTRAAARLRVLCSLFSGCENVVGKAALLKQLLAFATASSQLSALLPSLVEAPAWFDRWGLPADDKASLLIQLADAWTSINKREAAFSVLLKYLAKAKPSDTRSIVALRAISAFVTSPKVAVDANLDSFSAITSMKEANELLLQFLKPNVKSFASFAASNAATLQRAGISAESALESVRILALAVALHTASKSHSSLSLADAATVLDVPVEAVTGYVGRGVDAGLFQVQIDDVEDTIYPSRVTALTFDRASWEAVRDRLSGMSLHVKELADHLASETAGSDDEE